MALLQLYSSGLIFTPQKALNRGNFVRNPPGWLSKGPKVEENWSPELQTLGGLSHWVWSVAFSQDGQLLASGSDDKTIKLWDPTTGALKHTLLWDPTTGNLKHTLEGHSDWVRSVAFWKDSQLLASGSDDKTTRLWDPTTGALKHTLEGHSDSIRSVAFSQDGQLLASGSDDET
ncbi:hypothetical protein KXW24_007332, partial [Aspergillus fumigatus]